MSSNAQRRNQPRGYGPTRGGAPNVRDQDRVRQQIEQAAQHAAEIAAQQAAQQVAY